MGTELVHISEYEDGSLPGEWEDQIVHELPLSMKGRIAYTFGFSRSGGDPFIRKGSIEYIGNYERCKKVDIKELEGFKFRIKDMSYCLHFA